MTSEHVDPTRETFAELKTLPLDHPVDMLNLIRLREHAAYADGRAATGAEAYRAYGEHSAAFFNAAGGKIIWSATQELMVIGPTDTRWDIAFIARYPTGQAFLDMVYNPDYQAVTFHRTAAVADSRLIRMKAREAAEGFG